MSHMFRVRSARAMHPTSVGPSPAHRLRLRCPHALPFPGPRLAPCMPLLSTWQKAKAFNQPLSFDTSKVATMGYMFSVRSVRAPPPSLQSVLPRACAACAATTPWPPASRTASRPTVYALRSTRQRQSAFNQPLSFDTSSVTAMDAMFQVRTVRAVHPIPTRASPARTSPCFAYPPFDSAGI